MVSYTVDEVRTAAEGSSFHETSHNATSKVISFKNDFATRINVYYSTGTVGTCLNHPAKGKTQLFRRNIHLHRLAQIFINPRIHTGTGYYRKNNRQSWKTILYDGKEHFLVDSARRWEYVASATGLSTSVIALARMELFCNSFDRFCWDDGAEPKLSEMKYGMGSKLGTSSMLFEVMAQTIGYPVRGMWVGYGNVEKDKLIISPKQSCPCCRDMLAEFLEKFKVEIALLKLQLQFIPKDLRIEMIQWFFGRNNCGYKLGVQLAVNDWRLITTSYSDAVYSAHFDYADIAYTRKNAARMCKYHGVMNK